MSDAPAPSGPPVPLVILMPVYNDWEAARVVCEGLDRACRRVPGARVSVLLVDDWSTMPPGTASFAATYETLASVDVLHLRRNVGHQRAIAIGLSFLYDRHDAAAVLVMDGDGEDRPEDAAVLIEEFLTNPERAIFAERRRRLEGRVFTLGYHLYRFVHWILTGIPVRIGNFSILPRTAVGAIVLSSESWNHYAASAVKVRVPMIRVPMDRGRRLAGESQMNLVGLVIHGLSAVSVFRELVGTRLIIASVAASAASCVILAVLAALVFAHRMPLDRLTITLLLVTVLTMSQGIVASFAISFSALGGNASAPIIPARDYRLFVASSTTVWSASRRG